MTKDEALKMALEALERVSTVDDDCDILSPSLADAVGEAIDVIKEALANEALEKKADNARELGLNYEPEQEPVAWKDMAFARLGVVRDKMHHADVETIQRFLDGDYTTPPQRKPLSEQEIGAILEDINAFGTRLYTFARAIEAAHGIKGEA